MNHMVDEKLYREAIANGCSPRLAEMFASGQAPRAKTDDTFFRGWQDCGGANIKNPIVRDEYLKTAREAGVDVSGAVYQSELAAFPGDPRAWVRTRGEITGLIEERGWSLDGDLKAGTTDVEPADGKTKIAADIVERLAEDRMAADPGLKLEDARGQVIDKHSPSWSN